MNRVELMGRLTKNPELTYAKNENNTAVARYTLAVERKGKRDSSQGTIADFIQCAAFGKAAEFVVKYFKKGMRVAVCGRVFTSSYTNSEGNRMYSTSIVTDEHYFADSKTAGSQGKEDSEVKDADGFQPVAEGSTDFRL